MIDIIIDIILITIMLVGAIIGLKRGFIMTVAKPVKIFAAFLIAYTFASSFGMQIVEPVIYEPVGNHITDYLEEKCAGITDETAISELPLLIKFGATVSGVDIKSIEGESSEEIIGEIVSTLVTPSVRIVSVILSFIILYFVSKLIIALILKMLNGIFDRGISGGFNKLLGTAFGGAFAFIIAWLVAGAISYVIYIPSVSSLSYIGEFGGGPIYRFLLSFNPLDLLLFF